MRSFAMNEGSAGSRDPRGSVVLISLCLVCAAVNITKAVHIDDTAYLAIVDSILRDPLHVMSALFNWQDTAEPIATINQPHLFFYLQALVVVVFGRSELVQHLLMAAFASLAILLFYRLALLVAPRRPLVLTALFALSPAFLPGQNLMVDVPLTALWLLFFWAMLSDKASGRARYGTAAVAIAMACLVKYTSLVLIVVFAATIVRRRQWRALAWSAIPIAALAVWSALNVIDYGRIHLLDRGVATLGLRAVAQRLLDWIVGIGAVTPFAMAWWRPLTTRRGGRRVLMAGAAAAVAMFEMLRMHHWSGGMAAWWALFLGNGVLTLGLVALGAVEGGSGDEAPSNEHRIVLWWWLAGVTLFIVPLAPFIAVRHVLLVVPAILLLLGSDETLVFKRSHAAAAVSLTAVLGLALAISDYVYADVQRILPRQIQASLPEGARVWSVGHWGWQWYATQAGMRLYDVKASVLQEGDYLVLPAAFVGQAIDLKPGTVLRTVRQIVVPAGPLSWVRTVSFEPFGGYYAFSMRKRTAPPWLFSTGPLDRITIFRVSD